MFCQSCGKNAENIGKFCEFCGNETGFEEEKQELNSGADQVKTIPSTSYRKLSKKEKVCISLFAVIVIAQFVLYQIGVSMTNPEAIAKNYFSELSKCEYSETYNFLSLPKSEFLTIENYSKCMEKIYGKSPWVKTFKINEPSASNKAYARESESLSKNFSISYIPEDNNYERNMTINLVKSGEKKLLLFDDWKVDPGNIIDQEWLITIPKGGVLFINGKEVSKENIKTENSVNYYDSSSEGAKNQIYSIKNIFPGEYDIKVVMENGKEYTQKRDTEDYNSIITIVPDESLQSSIKEIIKKYNDNQVNAINTKVIDPMKESVIEDSKAWQDISYNIDNLRNNYKKYMLYLLSISYENMYLDDVSHIRVESMSSSKIVYTDNYDYSNTITNNRSSIYYLQKVDNKWLIYDVK